MDFVAVAKDGVHIYKVPESVEGERSQSDEPVVSLPPAGSAFGCAWSKDGSKLASVDQGKTIIWDADDGYKQLMEISAVGDTGGARALIFSPRSSFLITFEKYDRDKCPENMIVWDLRNSVKQVRGIPLKSYTSGAITEYRIQWTPDESFCFELDPGRGIIVLDEDLQAGDEPRLIKEPHVSQYTIAPAPQKDGYYVAMYIPEATNSWGAWDLDGRCGQVAIYHVTGSSIEKVTYQDLPRKLKNCTIRWNYDGTAVVFNAESDVDETGESYFGTTYFYWLKADGKARKQISGPQDGFVEDFAWSPNGNEFLLIVGHTINLYDGATGKLVKDGALGTAHRNAIRWNQFGRFFVVGGFGQLPGDVDFFDRSSNETLCSFRAALTVNCEWAPSGRHFLTCTTAPRMNEDNQISIWGYNAGNLLLKVDFRPKDGQAGGGRKAADAGAMLWAASWRPDGKGIHKDRPASPPPRGVKRVKGLPETKKDTSGGGAYRPRGGVGGVAAMMRGEMDVPQAVTEERGWGVPEPKPLSWEEQQKQQKELAKQKKEAEKKKREEEEEAKNAAKEELRAIEKGAKDKDKEIKKLKAELAELEKLKAKEWDEVTSEDEAALEGEVEIIKRLAELEKGK